MTQFGAIGLSSISANNRLILRTSSRLRSGSFATLSLARVSSSSRSSSANSFSSFSFTELLSQRRFTRGLHQTRSLALGPEFPTSFRVCVTGRFLRLVKVVCSVRLQFRGLVCCAGRGRLIKNFRCLICLCDPEDQEHCLGVGPRSAVAVVDIDSL